jgi:hypothetical protein
LKRADALPLPDAVFEFVFFNNAGTPQGRGVSCEPLDMAVLQRKHKAAEIEEWQQKALKLLRNAFELGDAFLRKDGTYKPLREKWERANPGFSSKTYQKVVNLGCFQAR